MQTQISLPKQLSAAQVNQAINTIGFQGHLSLFYRGGPAPISTIAGINVQFTRDKKKTWILHYFLRAQYDAQDFNNIQEIIQLLQEKYTHKKRPENNQNIEHVIKAALIAASSPFFSYEEAYNYLEKEMGSSQDTEKKAIIYNAFNEKGLLHLLRNLQSRYFSCDAQHKIYTLTEQAKALTTAELKTQILQAIEEYEAKLAPDKATREEILLPRQLTGKQVDNAIKTIGISGKLRYNHLLLKDGTPVKIQNIQIHEERGFYSVVSTNMDDSVTQINELYNLLKYAYSSPAPDSTAVKAALIAASSPFFSYEEAYNYLEGKMGSSQDTEKKAIIYNALNAAEEVDMAELKNFHSTLFKYNFSTYTYELTEYAKTLTTDNISDQISLEITDHPKLKIILEALKTENLVKYAKSYKTGSFESEIFERITVDDRATYKLKEAAKSLSKEYIITQIQQEIEKYKTTNAYKRLKLTESLQQDKEETNVTQPIDTLENIGGIDTPDVVTGKTLLFEVLEVLEELQSHSIQPVQNQAYKNTLLRLAQTLIKNGANYNRLIKITTYSTDSTISSQHLKTPVECIKSSSNTITQLIIGEDNPLPAYTAEDIKRQILSATKVEDVIHFFTTNQGTHYKPIPTGSDHQRVDAKAKDFSSKNIRGLIGLVAIPNTDFFKEDLVLHPSLPANDSELKAKLLALQTGWDIDTMNQYLKIQADKDLSRHGKALQITELLQNKANAQNNTLQYNPQHRIHIYLDCPIGLTQEDGKINENHPTVQRWMRLFAKQPREGIRAYQELPTIEPFRSVFKQLAAEKGFQVSEYSAEHSSALLIPTSKKDYVTTAMTAETPLAKMPLQFTDYHSQAALEKFQKSLELLRAVAVIDLDKGELVISSHIAGDKWYTDDSTRETVKALQTVLAAYPKVKFGGDLNLPQNRFNDTVRQQLKFLQGSTVMPSRGSRDQSGNKPTKAVNAFANTLDAVLVKENPHMVELQQITTTPYQFMTLGSLVVGGAGAGVTIALAATGIIAGLSLSIMTFGIAAGILVAGALIGAAIIGAGKLIQQHRVESNSKYYNADKSSQLLEITELDNSKKSPTSQEPTISPHGTPALQSPPMAGSTAQHTIAPVVNAPGAGLTP